MCWFPGPILLQSIARFISFTPGLGSTHLSLVFFMFLLKLENIF